MISRISRTCRRRTRRIEFWRFTRPLRRRLAAAIAAAAVLAAWSAAAELVSRFWPSDPPSAVEVVRPIRSHAEAQRRGDEGMKKGPVR